MRYPPLIHACSGALLPLLAAALIAGGCLPTSLRTSRPRQPVVLYPQSSYAAGTVWLQPRYAREPRPLTVPGLLEPGDWIETGPAGKVELLLPQVTLRLYGNTRLQVLFQFDQRTAVARELRLERGEVLVTRPAAAAVESFLLQTPGLHVDIPAETTVLVASNGSVHRAACYRGHAEARNVRVRGQTVIRLGEGHVLTVDDRQTLAFLEERKVADEWQRWEKPEIFDAGMLPTPAASAATAGPKGEEPAPASAAPRTPQAQ